MIITEQFEAKEAPRTMGQAGLCTQTITTGEAFRALRKEWNELLADSGVDSIFLTWEWMYTWWEHLAEDRKLHIITVRRQGRLIALAPVALRPVRLQRLLPFRVLEFLGAGNVGSDYLNVVTRKGYEREALEALAHCLSERRLVLQLSHVDRTSPQMVDLALRMRGLGWKLTRTTVDFCPYVDLRGQDWESYVESLGSSHRRNFRKRMKRLQRRFDVAFEQVSSEQQRGEVLDKLVSLHLERWNKRGGSDALHTRALVRFHHEMTRIAMARGWLRLFTMKLDGVLVAALYCFFYNGKVYFYQAGYDTSYNHYSVGLCAVGMAIRQAIGEGALEYDFLRGNESYKYLWSNKERELVRLDLFPPSVRGSLYKQAMEVRNELKKLLCRRVPQV